VLVATISRPDGAVLSTRRPDKRMLHVARSTEE
jgi:hypothetical protein